MHTQRPLQIGLGIALFGILTFAAFHLADSLSTSGPLRSFIETSGVLGMVFVAVISGLNPFVPLPPATFAPLFQEAGFSTITIIACFVIGTTIADTAGYLFGWLGKHHADTKHPTLTARVYQFLTDHERMVFPATFLYFAAAPLPNEIILIPLALAGYAYRKLIIPIIVGNIVHHAILVYGYQNIFGWLFG